MNAIMTALANRLSAIEEKTFIETCRIDRHGSLIALAVPCRIHSGRLFAEPGDPQDANMRSSSEFGFTMPRTTDVEIGDTLTARGGELVLIAGEVLKHDTWPTAVRVWATRPKNTTPRTIIHLWRYDPNDDDWKSVGAYDVHVVYDRREAREPPVRFSVSATSRHRGGWVIGDLDFDVRIGDRFTLDGFGCVITEVAPFQPQHREARFIMDISGH